LLDPLKVPEASQVKNLPPWGNLKMLFRQTRDMSSEAIKRIIRYIKIVENEEHPKNFNPEQKK
jgi:hypothetical protein